LTEEEYIDQLASDISGFIQDPLGYVVYAFPWGEEGELKDKLGPEPWQVDVLKDIGASMKAGQPLEPILEAIASGHGIGKSALVAWVIMWGLSTCVDTKIVVTANTENQLKTKTWAELAKWHRLAINGHWFKYTATALFSSDKKYEKTWRADMIPWSEHKTEAFAGLHNKGKRIVVIFDESSAIPDVIWEVTEGALTDENTEIIWLVCGNPTRNTGRFHGCFNKFRHRWKHIQVDSRQVSLTNKEQILKWEEDYGDDSDFFRVRVKGQFPRASSNQFIPTDIADAARGRHLKEADYNFAAVIIGLDRAWSNDETKIWLRQGNFSQRLATVNKGEDDVVVAGQLARFEDEHEADAVFIDFGYGTGIFSIGKQMGRDWQMIQFGSASPDSQYLNQRMYMWAKMRDWLRDGGSIPDDDDIYTDLISPEAYEIAIGSNAGKMKLESKDDMDRRGIDSPDDGDALALTFALPVRNKSQKRFEKATASFNKEYDPLSTAEVQQPVYNPLSPIA
jgi:hypothetical protein